MVALVPATVTVTGNRGPGRFATEVLLDGVAPVARNGVTSPSPVMYAVIDCPGLPVLDGVSRSPRVVKNPGAVTATVMRYDATCPLLFTPSTAVPALVS